MSSAGTARNAPKARSRKSARMELGLLIQGSCSQDLGHSPQRVLRLNGRGASSGRRKNLRPGFYSCLTGAAKKNDRRHALRMCINLHTGQGNSWRNIAITLKIPPAGVLSEIAWFHQLSSCAFRAMQESRPDIGRQCIRCASFYLSLRLLKIEPHLSKLGGFLRVHSGPQISFL